MKRVGVYARYSSDRQNERSIDDQFALGDAIVPRLGGTIVARYSDRATSGAATINRPDFLRAIADAEAGAIDAIWIEDQNRAFRNEADYHLARGRLEFFGIELWNVRGPIGRIEGSFYAMMDAITLDKLAQQTRRGMQGVARAGKNAGGKAYGYRIGGTDQPGVLLIDEDQAAIVRRIFSEYVAGRSTRSIASDLNRDGILPPRGNHWNASTINGSRARQSGILFNPLYDGRVIWNRQQFRKHPDSRKRLARANDRADWIEAKAEHLRIVDAATFAAAQSRKAKRAPTPGGGRKPGTSARYLLSGLLKCGACGSNFTASGHDKRGVLFICSRARESGTCDHQRSLPVKQLEARVLDGLAANLGDPQLIREYVREYHRRAAELRQAIVQDKQRLERQLAELTREAERLVDAIAKGAAVETVKDRLMEIETKRADLKATLATSPPIPIPLHPGAAEAYQRQIANLKIALASPDPRTRADVFPAARALIDRIVILPGERYRPPELEIHGRLASLLNATAAPEDQRRKSGVLVVAGEGFEPPTSGL